MILAEEEEKIPDAWTQSALVSNSSHSLLRGFIGLLFPYLLQRDEIWGLYLGIYLFFI